MKFKVGDIISCKKEYLEQTHRYIHNKILKIREIRESTYSCVIINPDGDYIFCHGPFLEMENMFELQRIDNWRERLNE